MKCSHGHWSSLLLIGYLLCSDSLLSQISLGKGSISGSFSLNSQLYQPDSIIGAVTVPDHVRANASLSVNYNSDNFRAGFRYENYQAPLVAFEQMGLKGHGIPYYFAEYQNDFITVTGGSFYEQFGSGLTLRTYEDKDLGVDNSLNGARVRITPYTGIQIKGVWGVQRRNFDYGKGQVRGGDLELTFSDMFPVMAQNGFVTALGGSFVSKYEKATLSDLVIPENVATMASRLKLGWKSLFFEGEYAYKINDPNGSYKSGNNMIYRPGQAFLGTLNYFQSGLGASLSFIRSDNFDFRSERTASISPYNQLSINYVPAINYQWGYSLPARNAYQNMPNGQTGLGGQFNYKFKKGTLLGGKTGMDLMVNYSRMHAIDTVWVDDARRTGRMYGTLGYDSRWDQWGEMLYQDIGLTVTKRFDKSWKLIGSYIYNEFNQPVLQHHGVFTTSHTVVADLTWKINHTHALRMELQGNFAQAHQKEMSDKQFEAALNDYYGSWVMGLLEYSISPRWFITVQDQWNVGNPNPAKRIHYFNIAGAFVYNTTRIALSWGKTSKGVLCVGGICREVPASNGLNLSVTTTF